WIPTLDLIFRALTWASKILTYGQSILPAVSMNSFRSSASCASRLRSWVNAMELARQQIWMPASPKVRRIVAVSVRNTLAAVRMGRSGIGMLGRGFGGFVVWWLWIGD